MDAIVAAALNEISARGGQGCLLPNLWSGLQSAIASAGLHLCDGVKQAIWQALLKVPGLSFAAPESSLDCLIPTLHPSIQAVEDAERLRVNIVAPEHLRDSCVGLYDLKFSDAGLSSDQRFALERLAKARTQGVTQNQLAKEFGIKGNKMFYIVRSLESRGLLIRQSTLVRTKEGGSETENGFKSSPIVNTNLIHLPRYAKHLNLSSQQRFEIRKSSASECVENSDRSISAGIDIGEEGGREDLLIKDDLPAMKAVCDKLEEADGKVLVVSDLKVTLGYRLTVGHRAWRRISKRLLAAGLVEVFRAQIDKKVVSCIRLLKSFDPRTFHPKAANCGNDDFELEQPLKGAKRGQATEQLAEIPIDHQIYDMIDSEGSKGLTVTEVWKRLGLNNKRNYYRLTNMVSRFGLHLRAESHKRSMLYRVWTADKLNCYANNDSANKQQQDLPKEIGTSKVALFGERDLRLVNDSYGSSRTSSIPMKTGRAKPTAAPHRGRLKIKIKQMKSELDKGGHNLAENSQALVCTEATIKQSILDGNADVAAEDIEPKDTVMKRLKLIETVHMPPPVTSTPPILRAGQRYPCLTVTTVGAQREQRILERLKVDKFILRVELYRWLEDLEKGKSTTMDRKTLTRALQKLQREGHCKSILVSVPVVTNCGRSRTTEVVLHPSLEVGPELLGQIHERLRNFDMQSRGQGLARSKNDECVPILTGVKRTFNTEPSDFQMVRAESMRANGFIPAKMVRVKLLHQFLWGYVSSLPDWDAALSAGKHGYDIKNPHSTCKLFALDTAIKAMPLELFLQVIGSVKKIGDLAESCRHGVCLCDLPEQEFKMLMDAHATGRLSWLVDVVRRLKLLRLVMIRGHGGEHTNMVSQAVLTYAMELKPYIEEPAPRAVPSLTANVFDLRPRVRHDFILSSREALDAYWKTLEYCFCAAEPTVAARAFPGSTVPEIFVQRSWTSVRVMSVDQRTELLKRVANDDLEKRISFKECVKIAKDLNLTLEQVLRVSYEKNRKARLQALQREAIKPSDPRDGMQIGTKYHQPISSKRKRTSQGEPSECENMEVDLKQPSMHKATVSSESIGRKPDPFKGSQTAEEECNAQNKAQREGSNCEGGEQGDLDEDDGNEDIFINHISSLSRLKPTRKRRFPWTDSLERSLITSYARYRAALGARYHRVDWGMIPGLPAPSETCRRRIASLKHEPTVRKALMNLCTLLATRYSKSLQQIEQMDMVEALDSHSVGVSEGLPTSMEASASLHGQNSSSNSSQFCCREKFEWDDFEEPSIAAAVDEVIRCKCMAKLSVVKRFGGSATFVTKWSESVPPDKLTSVTPVDNGFGHASGVEHESLVVGDPNTTSSSSPCSALDAGIIASTSSTGCIVPFCSNDEHPSGRVNIGGGRTRSNRRRVPKKVQRLLQNEDLSTEKLVHKSIAVANAVELIKLVFLNSSADTEVPKLLVDTLRRYNEFDVFAAFNFLRAHGLVVVGHGVQPFVLSSKFFHNASASPFPIGTGERSSRFANWLNEVQKELEEDWISLPAEQHCGDIFHLFGLVSSGEILIRPSLPTEGIGEADDPRGLKRKIDKDKASRDPQFVKQKLQWPKDGELCSRRERGFPGIQVHVHLAAMPMTEMVRRNWKDKEQNWKEKDQLENALDGQDDQCSLNFSPSIRNVNHDIESNHSCDLLDGRNLLSMESHKLSLKDLVNFAGEILSSKIVEQEEPDFFEPEWFERAFDAILRAGEEGLSLEQVAHSIGANAISMEQVDAIVEALQSFNHVIKVNAFDHIRAVAFSQSTKYSLHVSSANSADVRSVDTGSLQVMAVSHNKNSREIQNICVQENEGFCRPSILPSMSIERHKDMSMTVGDGHLVTILEMPEMDTENSPSSMQCDPCSSEPSEIIDKCDGRPASISSLPPAENVGLGEEMNHGEDSQRQFLPILPWLTGDGETNSTMLKALTRRVMGIVMQHPGISEDDLIKQLDILNPQSARKLLHLLELDDHLHVRTMHQTSRSPPSLLKGLIGANFEEQNSVWRRHYYANPLSTTML